jgi:hypothetical protein
MGWAEFWEIFFTNSSGHPACKYSFDGKLAAKMGFAEYMYMHGTCVCMYPPQINTLDRYQSTFASILDVHFFKFNPYYYIYSNLKLLF